MKKIFLNLLLFVCFISCSNKDVNINEKLSRLEINSEFMLDTINVANWDSMYVIGPYLNEKAYSHLEIPESVKEVLNKNRMLDTQCTLLFFKESQFVNYAVVALNIVDFTPLVNENKTYSLVRQQNYSLKEGRIVEVHEIYNR